MATLLLSHGTPMILAGDEFSRSQGGNNNGYAQDSEISWVIWDLNDNAKALQAFVRRLIALRHTQPLFERSNWRDMMSVTWLNAGGGEQQAAHWEDGGATTIAVRFARDDLQKQNGAWWEAIVVFNPHDGPVSFKVPARAGGDQWSIELNTLQPEASAETVAAEAILTLEGRTMIVLA